jgi:pimeloyl-ACP methyl ester carboxylesterase
MAVTYTRELYARNPATLPARNHVACQKDLRDRTTILGSVRRPALVIHGEEDPLVPQVGGRLTAEAIPGATYLTLPGVGHMFFNRETWRTLEAALAPHFAAAG